MDGGAGVFQLECKNCKFGRLSVGGLKRWRCLVRHKCFGSRPRSFRREMPYPFSHVDVSVAEQDNLAALT